MRDPAAYWAEEAADLWWAERCGPAYRALPEPPYAEWFRGWTSNLAVNCLDRWVEAGAGERVAFRWEGEPGDRRTVTYAELLREVDRMAAVLAEEGVRPNDRVTVYLPLLPEAVVAMLAIARLGAVHSVVFGGFAASALAQRISDCRSELLITADGGWRNGEPVELKRIADEALRSSSPVRRVLVLRRTGRPVEMDAARDRWYDDLARAAPSSPAVGAFPAERPLFVLYTSGTTGRPKGIVHALGGYMVWARYTMGAVFAPRADDRYWCTADVGWITGHTYVVYGPLLSGASSVLYEGAPNFPTADRWWELIERHGVTILYTSPTAIRGAMRQGDEAPGRHRLNTLRLLGSVGEPINPAAWRWYARTIGGGRCPIVDTWWQTETGGIMISDRPRTGSSGGVAGTAGFPLPGVDAAVVGARGERLGAGRRGYLTIRRPWPGQFRTVWNDPARFLDTYYARFPGVYYAADYARTDARGRFRLLGRADEVMKVAGHRLSTTEIEDALVGHPSVAESAVVGRADPVKSEVPVAYVVLRPPARPTRALARELLDRVRREIGAIAVPAEIVFVERVPKTRSGKIMRRLLKDVVEDRPVGDTTTLEDESTLEVARAARAALAADLAASRRAQRA